MIARSIKSSIYVRSLRSSGYPPFSLRKLEVSTAGPALRVTPARIAPFTTAAHRRLVPNMTDTSEPTSEQATALFEELEQGFPSKSLGEDRWYLVAVNTLHPILSTSFPSLHNAILVLHSLANSHHSDLRPHRRRAARIRRSPLQTPYRTASLLHIRSASTARPPLTRSACQMRLNRRRMQAYRGGLSDLRG